MKDDINIVSDSTIKKESNEYVKNSKSFYFVGRKDGLPFCLYLRMAIKYKYSFGSIAKLLNIDCQEVCRQFNQMIKESNYNLFN
jgi:hypothetical protein